MTDLEWFNKPVEKSRDLILKEAFKLFLQNNIEKVTVPELERVTKLQRGAIFYHFKSKEEIFREVIERYFFSPLNIFSPIVPDGIHSLKEYWDRKNEHLVKIQCWFKQEGILINPCTAFFHLTDEANLYIFDFKEKMLNLIECDKKYWKQAVQMDRNTSHYNLNSSVCSSLLRGIYIEQYYTACYCEKLHPLDYPCFLESIFVTKK
ncbi:TetR/AcrR family transcriptional regulator [Bacteroides ovatus]|uniref:TetR/AcrR family transcriptional regulator n=1 Tax=Bacteroides ovatus TaxID=28116 RepID=UPI0022E0EC63|nr:TetR/AcrR family transcriptional regulator [Bacteroides ovatus]